jgi:metal-responsive CopG/Arc/MetJ family transcriptional regulator
VTGRRVVVEINQQQAELIDRLVAQGVGASRAEVIRKGFAGFCADLMSILEPAE